LFYDFFYFSAVKTNNWTFHLSSTQILKDELNDMVKEAGQKRKA